MNLTNGQPAKISIMGCGWLGLPLAKKLFDEGYTVKGSTTTENKISALQRSGIEPYLLVLGEDNDHIDDFLKSDILVVNIPPGRSDETEFKRHMSQLAETVDRSEVRRVIYISSTSVYPNGNGLMTEQNATYTKTPRSGISMLAIEEAWHLMKNTELVILRFAGLYGPGRNPGKFLAGKETTGGQNPVNMIHLNDCIAIMKLMLNDAISPGTYNACATVHPCRKDFYTEAAKLFGLQAPLFKAPELTDHKMISSEKLVRETGYQFIYPDPIASLPSLLATDR